ncbi:MAG TPA: recombinase family protein [Dehalococcoidia bacterium]|nr:recombinase family protein [Dehalococcoidia bacterium]
MQAVCYLRATPSTPLADQQRLFLDYCDRHGLEAAQVYQEDPGAANAPQFRRMLREQGGTRRGFSAIVVASLEVLGPTAREQARRYLQLQALALPLRIADGRDPDQALLSTWLARDPRERRRDQVREGMRRRALRGEVLGRAPYGYRVVDRHLHIDPVEGDVVREIFRRYLEEGEGVRVIARRLNEAGIPTRRGGTWSMVSVRGVLKNPVYTGTYRRLGVVVATEHDALVTRGRFYAAQQRLAQRRTSGGPQARSQYLLSGLARCGYCGNSLIGVRRVRAARRPEDKPVVYTYYQCESRTNQSRCAYHTRRAPELEGIVRERLRQGPPSGVAATEEPAALDEELTRLRGRRDGIRRQLDALLERHARGEWTMERLRAEASTLALEDLAAEERAESLVERRTAGVDGRRREATLARARARLAREWDDLEFQQRQDLLREVATAVIVTDDDVRVDFAG